MSRSPCVAASSLKTFLPVKDFKGSYAKVNSLPSTQAQRRSLSPYSQCNSSFQPQQSSVSPNHFQSSPNHLTQRRDSFSLSVDSPQRLLFVSKIKTSTSATSNFLGRGRFGQVVLAKYKDAQVAVKLIKNASKQDLVNEKNGQFLTHPNIISTLKIESIEDDVLILMEPWGPLNLQQLLSMSVKLHWDDILSYAKQLAKALEYCHGHGVLHLDVKPANIMVNSQKWIKLGDFGNSARITQLNSSQSLAQQKVGTVSYCAPEILQGDLPSTKSDVYSYGITLWQLDNNQLPFSDLSWPTIAYLVVAKDARPDIRQNLDEDETKLADIYKSCWQPKHLDRPSMSEIISKLSMF